MFEISIEPTNVCNLECVMCPYPLQTRTKGFMEFELFEKIIRDVRAMGPIRTLHLQELGESFLHPRMVDMINVAHGAATELHVNTNGIPFLKPKLRQDILNSSLDSLTFSINGHSKETYAKAQGKDLYEHCKKAFELLLEDKKAAGGRGPELLAKMVLMDFNRHEWPDFKAHWEERGADKAVFKEAMDWHGDMDQFGKPLPPMNRWRCHYLWNNMTVQWDGDVVPCCIDWDKAVVFGNVRETPLMDIFLGEAASKFRKEHLAGQYHPMCAGCDYWAWNQAYRKIDTGEDIREDASFRSLQNGGA